LGPAAVDSQAEGDGRSSDLIVACRILTRRQLAHIEHSSTLLTNVANAPSMVCETQFVGAAKALVATLLHTLPGSSVPGLPPMIIAPACIPRVRDVPDVQIIVIMGSRPQRFSDVATSAECPRTIRKGRARARPRSLTTLLASVRRRTLADLQAQ